MTRPRLTVYAELLAQQPMAVLVAAPATGSAPPARPFLSPLGIHLPAALPSADMDPWTRAALAHAAAHRRFPRTQLSPAGRKPLTRALAGCLEDARVEALLGAELPGLRRLWREQHVATPASGDGAEALIARLSRALSDPEYADPHPWIAKGRRLFAGGVTSDAELFLQASLLGNDLGQQRLPFNDRTYLVEPSYRDDHRWLWRDHDELQHEVGAGASGTAAAVEVASTSDLPPPPAGTGLPYPEWDYRIRRLRPAWAAIHERRAPAGIRAQATVGLPLRLDSAVAQALQASSRGQRGRDADGDELAASDLCAFGIAWRGRLPIDPRVWQRQRPRPRRSAWLVLIDRSASTAEPSSSGCPSALQIASAVAQQVAQAARARHLPCAVQAFASNGRSLVEFMQVVAADEPWDAAAEARLAGLVSAGSTRIGAALRHATRLLADHQAEDRYVLLLSDGEPHDIDSHDPHYLVADAAQAVTAAGGVGVQVRLLRIGGRTPPRWLATDAWRPYRASAPLAPELRRLL